MVDDHPNVIVLEVCDNCSAHQWNTRHDNAKYNSYADQSKFSSRVTRYSDCCD